MKLKRIKALLVLCLTIGVSGCNVYSFTGASISPDVKTLSITRFYNNALLGPSDMSQTFTEKLRDYFQRNTSLDFEDQNGDLQFDGFIESYRVTPVAPSGRQENAGNVSSLSRLTVSVKVQYVNMKDDTFDFNRSFSFFEDFDANTTDLTASEDEFLDRIFDQIILDIFNASVANW